MLDGMVETFVYWWPVEQAAREQEARRRALAAAAREPRPRPARDRRSTIAKSPRPAGAVGR